MMLYSGVPNGYFGGGGEEGELQYLLCTGSRATRINAATNRQN